MFNIKKSAIFAAFLILSACADGELLPCMCESAAKPEVSEPVCSCAQPQPIELPEVPQQPTGNTTVLLKNEPNYANDKDTIVLLNPTSRNVATCYRTKDVSAETCAEAFESKGYVKLSELPYKPAEYDFLKTDNYPSRRWRNGELTPRW